MKVITPRPKRRLRNLSIRKASATSAAGEGSSECAKACAKCAGRTPTTALVDAACGHSLCKGCVAAHVAAAVAQLRCTRLRCPCEGCGAALDASFVHNSTSEELNQQYLDACFSEFLALEARADDNHLLTCPNKEPHCGCPMEWLQPSEEEVKKYGENKITRKAEDGTPLSRVAWVHFNINRIRCPQCSTDFCASCMAQPYHLGVTCEQLKEYAASKQCRFCGCRVTLGVNLAPLCGHEALMACCDDEECMEKRDSACYEVHACGHPCGGVRDEEHCLPCLQPECLEGASGQPNVHDFCSICWISDLGSEPCIKLACRHIVHARCAKRVLQTKWNTLYINFEFWNCPTCKAPLEHPHLEETLSPLKALQQRVVEIGRKVVEEEAVTEDLRSLNDKDSKYYRNVAKLVLEKLTFFQCDRCEEPFYGGRMDCIERNALEAEEGNSAERLCTTCEAKSMLVCSTPSHRSFWVYKCRYCCSRAKFFCFGDTHFCEPCHGNVGALRAMEEYPQCSGPKECPLGLEHAPNGEEYVIGCELCLEEFERSPQETRRLREYEALQERRKAVRERAVYFMSRASLLLFSVLALVQAADWEVLTWTVWISFHVLKFTPAAVAAIATLMMFLPRRTFSRFTLIAAVIAPMIAVLVTMDFVFALPVFSGFHIVSFFKLQDILLRITSYIARIAILILPGCFSLLYLLEQQPARAMEIAVCGIILNALSFVFGFVTGHSSLGDIVDASVAVVRVAYVCFILLGYVSYSMFKCNLGFQHNRWRMLELLASFAVCWAMIMELVIYNVGHVDHVFALQYYDILLRLILLARFAPWVMFVWLLVWPPSSVLTRFRLYVLLLSSFVTIEASCWYFELTWCALFWNCLTIFRCALYKC